MKRILFIVAVLSCILFSFQTSSAQEIKRKTIMGTWRLDSILYDNIKAYSTIKVFGDVDAGCMINSIWTFYGNWDGKILSPMAEGCPTTPQTLVWSTVKDGDGNVFGIKPLLAGQKGKQITQGFKIPIQSIDGKNMVWHETVNLNYKTSHVTYFFTKTSNKAK
ncbi:hypothetical protein [Solitalea canadensis]|uniref:Lipocalin-like domain-containing protein n=1 Tax=Solitalea canadensis (strain ATCC 29591 / DSM 3403 / JCM 21819 / LMG 8368 / NBRC 15130 / NCIMB 12057 / USAM 9D) TaxID=929556 RepID=H8KS66_SOLCM|nr:hypothetical protein [Solitalea canadensis]AFD07854.1 hypothetical protein Solca_2828 [Solitalea canadensis DSM 3403]